MKFDSAREAIEWLVWVCDMGAFASGSFESDEDAVDLREVDMGSGNLTVLQDIIHAKVDIEKIFMRCFPQPWVQAVMLHWAVDGYTEALGVLHNTSPFHKQRGRTTHTEDLSGWIFRLTDALFNANYIRTNQVKVDEAGVVLA